MILGMSPLLFVHVVVSLIGIGTGMAVAHWLITGKPHAGWTETFLVTTILTSLTGFPLPATQLLPSHILGIISIVLLSIAVSALYIHRLRGAWRWINVVSAIIALYVNVFVSVVQSFQKIAFLTRLARRNPKRHSWSHRSRFLRFLLWSVFWRCEGLRAWLGSELSNSAARAMGPAASATAPARHEARVAH